MTPSSKPEFWWLDGGAYEPGCYFGDPSDLHAARFETRRGQAWNPNDALVRKGKFHESQRMIWSGGIPYLLHPDDVPPGTRSREIVIDGKSYWRVFPVSSVSSSQLRAGGTRVESVNGPGPLWNRGEDPDVGGALLIDGNTAEWIRDRNLRPSTLWPIADWPLKFFRDPITILRRAQVRLRSQGADPAVISNLLMEFCESRRWPPPADLGIKL